MPTLTALGKKPKGAGALGANFIHENYTAAERNHDFMGQPERKNPVYAEPRKPFRDPLTMPVVESPHIRAIRQQLNFRSSFKLLVRERELLQIREIDQQVPRYVPFLEPLPEVIHDFHAAAKARAEAHAEWMAQEHADNAARRLARILRAV